MNEYRLNTFRAVRAAGGWTKKALERATRKIEISQGWEIERSGRYEVNSSGQIFEKKESARKSPKISQKARDIEAHTGLKSLERQAKREIAKILETATSWDELHRKLASKEYELERKGNVKQGDRALKLSNISRSSSFLN